MTMLDDRDQLLLAALREVAAKNAEIKRLRTELAAARDALRNDFEPDNQSRAWHRANNALQ